MTVLYIDIQDSNSLSKFKVSKKDNTIFVKIISFRCVCLLERDKLKNN